MSFPLSRTARWSATALAATAVTLAGFGAGLGSGDRLVIAGFASALNAGAAAPASAGARSGSLAQLSGSEAFWLDGARPALATMPVAWTAPFSIGDRVTISSGGREQQLEVVDIRDIGGSAPEAGSDGSDAQPLLLVTCRDVAAPEARPVRFVIEKNDAPPGHIRRAPHAL
jgi:hypothetical protein